MGYDIEMIDNSGRLVQVRHAAASNQGGIVGGAMTLKPRGSPVDAYLHITANYSPIYKVNFPGGQGIGWLHGRTGKETESVLGRICKKLGVKRDQDYYKTTYGNAGFALGILYSWAVKYPQGKFVVSS